ncbi:UNVERIFIED_CONTAM: hypothetical protein Sradi_4916900 [Sesamum radiatum]|uniref:Uncharacterized protein n=1 Tax=Sesamum radiatum TaxID=300843 RepID=A0AAW2MDB8_SESRA
MVVVSGGGSAGQQRIEVADGGAHGQRPTEIISQRLASGRATTMTEATASNQAVVNGGSVVVYGGCWV